MREKREKFASLNMIGVESLWNMRKFSSREENEDKEQRVKSKQEREEYD
jgi:hypothetical protein